jgi:hypothetical protein
MMATAGSGVGVLVGGKSVGSACSLIASVALAAAVAVASAVFVAATAASVAVGGSRVGTAAVTVGSGASVAVAAPLQAASQVATNKITHAPRMGESYLIFLSSSLAATAHPAPSAP